MRIASHSRGRPSCSASRVPTSTRPCLWIPARHAWDVDFLDRFAEGSILVDRRAGAPRHHAWWSGDKDQVGAFIHAYRSTWLPATLLEPEGIGRLARALHEASRSWNVALHFSRGLAVGSDPVRAARLTGARHPAAGEG